MTPGEWASLGSACISALTLLRVVFGESARTKRQLELLEALGALRKEMADGYVDVRVYKADQRSMRHTLRNIEHKIGMVANLPAAVLNRALNGD